MMIDKIAVMNEARARHRADRDTEVRNQAELLFEKYKDDPLFVAGVMLYWAEGTRISKSSTNRKYQLALTNSNPELLEVYCNFLRKYFGDIELNLRMALYIYQDIDELSTKSFWSARLRVPLDQFIKTQILPSRAVLTKNKLSHGICCLYLNGKDYCLRMETWIKNISDYMRG
ncbi:MAG: hypothetical protein KKD29_06030 [Candidatus Omnitrophica bacterium]|nr:hypothetical protein [Candidatus Omnitrophota bacterium]MBU4488674.1 hypothetical protein [Candidatus Omnitrophota bacterium]MCG2704797.1 hypothetical protein [Candidatus Omnitrophota bacterium]